MSENHEIKFEFNNNGNNYLLHYIELNDIIFYENMELLIKYVIKITRLSDIIDNNISIKIVFYEMNSVINIIYNNDECMIMFNNVIDFYVLYENMIYELDKNDNILYDKLNYTDELFEDMETFKNNNRFGYIITKKIISNII